MREGLYMQNKVKVYVDGEQFIVEFGNGSSVTLNSDEDILYLQDD